MLISELRTRGGPLMAATEEVSRFQLPGYRSATRLPGGNEASLQAATPARLQAFYDRWYRPENALLVIVGDLPVDALEALAKQGFSDWAPRGTAGVRPPPPPAMPGRGLDAFVKTDDALPPALSSCRTGPRRAPAADPIAALRRETYSKLWTTILDSRFAHLGASRGSALMGGAALVNDRLPDARATCLIAVTNGGKWKETLQAQQTELRRFERDGPTQQELDTAVEQLRAPLRGAAIQADSRTSAALAEQIADADLVGHVFASPAEQLRTYGIAVAGLTPADVKKAFADDWSGAGPLLVAMGPTPPVKEELLGFWRENEGAPAPAAYADRESVAWPYQKFGRPGRVDRREALADFVRLHFRNGTILNFKQTDFKPGDAEIRVRFGRGERGIAAADRAVLELGAGLVPDGGLGRINYEQIGTAFASTSWKFAVKVEPTAFVMSSSPMNDQVWGELQLLAAYATDPAFRPDLDTKLPTAVDFIYRYFKTDPVAVATDALEQKIFPGIGTLPPVEVARSWRAADFARLMKPVLTQSPVEVTIVGDLSEKDAIAAVASTFGALPARQPLPATADAGVMRHFPTDLPREIIAYHQGPRDKAAATLTWPLYEAVPQRRKEEYALALVAGIFRERLFHEARVNMGRVYEADVSDSMPDYGDEGAMTAQIQASPGDLDALIGVARRIAADLASGKVSQEEMDRVRQLFVTQRAPLTRQNASWAGLMSHQPDNPNALDELLRYSPQMAALTLDDVRTAATTWLKREPVVVKSLPQPVATSAAAH